MDKYYLRIVRAVAKILSHSNVVAPLDVLMEMGNLTKQNHDVGVIVFRLLPRSGFIGLIRF